MASPPQKSSFERVQQRKRFPWILGVMVSIAFLAILAFVIVTLLILQSQGISRGINTLTIISIVGSFMIGVFGLLLSFLQWHHSRLSNQSELTQHSSPQTSPLGSVGHLPSSSTLVSPLQQYKESNVDLLPLPSQKNHRIDWGEAPHAEQFYGRDRELARLKLWMIDDHCHLIAVLGMGGIGKTSLAATLVGQVHEYYDCVFWRSLHNATPFKHLLQECIQFVSNQQQTVLPEEVDSQISLLIEYLRTYRCLMVLDNVESILQEGSQTGHYREGYQAYGRLFHRIGESKHQSCLLITSREKPPEVAFLEGEATATRSLHLGGLKPADGRDILGDKGLQGTEHDWEALISHYEGNPLALKLVAPVIRDVFAGMITTFLTGGELFFRDVRDVLEQQLKRLSALEEEIVYWLAIEREATALSDLRENIVHAVPKGELQEALRSLRRRHLIETSATGFILQPVIMEYLTDRLVDQICEEIRTETLVLFVRHALLKAQAKEYIRQSQYRLILQPLLQRLLAIFGKEALEQRLQDLLAALREQADQHSGYAAGNMLNLLIQIGCTLRRYDFSHLVVRQAYLKGVDLPEVNFAYANLATSVFTDTFGSVPCVMFSTQGDLLAAGTVTGEIRVWHAGSRLPLYTLSGHTDWVWGVAFSPDGKTLASGSVDQLVNLWEVSSGQLLNTLQGHTGAVISVAFSPDGKLLASSSFDQTVRLWEVSSGKVLNTLQGHTGAVRSVTFSPDGKLLAGGSSDQTVCLWEVSNGQLLNILESHIHKSDKIYKIYAVAFSPDGKLLAGSSASQVIRLWDVRKGQLLNTLQGHTSIVRSVAFSPDGKTLASGSADRTVRLWEVSSGKVLHILQGYTNRVLSVAFSPDGKTLASGSADRTVRLLEVGSGRVLNALHGHSHWIRSVAFSPDGSLLASGSEDRTVRLWETSSGKMLYSLQVHTEAVYSVIFSPDGSLLASSSIDGTVRLWETSSGRVLHILQGHTDTIPSVAFSPDGKLLASGSEDRTVRLWETSSGKALNTLQAHTNTVHSAAFSPDGKLLASGSGDRSVHLWEVSSGKMLYSLQGYTEIVHSVAFSPDGKLLASGSFDQTVRLWEVSSRKLLHILQGHLGTVWSVAFSPDGKLLASGGFDQTVRLWEVSSGRCLHIWRSDRLYEQMNITQVKGLTEVQKATLRSLGAIEEAE